MSFQTLFNDEFSASTQKVLFIIEEDGPITSSEIIKRVDYSTRSVRYALKNLLRKNLIRKQCCLDDMRKSYYSLSDHEQAKAEVIFHHNLP